MLSSQGLGNSRYVDKAFDQLKNQVRRANELYADSPNKFKSEDQMSHFKNTKEALKFSLKFNKQLIGALETVQKELRDRERVVTTQTVTINQLLEEIARLKMEKDQ